MSNYGLHIPEIVSDAHHAVTNLLAQDTDDQDRTEQLPRWHTATRGALHISELANE